MPIPRPAPVDAPKPSPFPIGDPRATPQATPPRSFHIMTKPIGSACNLDCTYCFYLEKERLYPGVTDFRMSEATLENYTRQHIAQQDTPEITFTWQGGEPTLLGVKFFQRALELQRQYCPPGRTIANSLQTNGTLLNEDWCRLFHEHKFLIGLSIDGPRELHDRYRVNKGGRPTFDAVFRGMQLLQKHQVDFNTLTVVNREVAQHPLEVYRFLKQCGVEFLQFIPLVERYGAQDKTLADPPLLKVLNNMKTSRCDGAAPEPGARSDGAAPGQVTPWSVDPREYGQFLCQIFDDWVRHDVGQRFIQMFDVQLGIEMGLGSSLCVFGETCGKAVAMEHNGDLYSCDHFVYPQYKLGNIHEQSIESMINSAQQQNFGTDKRDTLPQYCRQCPVKEHCWGECPKHRFLTTPDGEPGLNYLCAGYKIFFPHIKPYLEMMANLLRAGHPAAEIMPLLQQRPQGSSVMHPTTSLVAPTPGLAPRAPRATGAAGRNDPCPCGSGRKFKKCCGQ